MDKRLYKMILTSLFTAIVTVATILIQIPMPMQGYVNLGDCLILLASWLLGPTAGFFAGGVGSMLADLLTGYSYYAPGSLLIKGGMGVVAALLFSLFSPARKKSDTTESKMPYLDSVKTAEFEKNTDITKTDKPAPPAPKTRTKAPRSALLFSSAAAEAVMVLGYFLYACLLLGNGLSATASIPGNLIQGLVGSLSATVLYPLIERTGIRKGL